VHAMSLLVICLPDTNLCMHVALDRDSRAVCALEQCASMSYVAQNMLDMPCHAIVTSVHSLQTPLPWSPERCFGLFRVLMKLSELCKNVPEGHISLQVHIVKSQCRPCIGPMLHTYFAVTLHVDVVCPAHSTCRSHCDAHFHG